MHAARHATGAPQHDGPASDGPRFGRAAGVSGRRAGAREVRVRLLLDEARIGPETLLIAVVGADELNVALVDRHHAEALAFRHRQATEVVEVLLLRLRLAVTLVVQYGVK